MNNYLRVYRALLKAFGEQRWWPVVSQNPKLEICFGAILTQNTSWKNVEKAIANLKESDLISVTGIMGISTAKLASIIKPSGYYNQKAKKLKNFCGFLARDYQGDLDQFFSCSEDTDVLRDLLLEINGIGKETADSILLFSAERPSFVVDAYTRRIFSRLGLAGEKEGYDEIRGRFMELLSRDTQLFREYHALIVRLGKDFCRKKPDCNGCPLVSLCNR